MDGSTLISVINQRLEQDMGIPTSEQSLKKDGVDLDPTATIDSAGLAHGDMIVLEGEWWKACWPWWKSCSCTVRHTVTPIVAASCFLFACSIATLGWSPQCMYCFD
jgi:hypothetical protein